MHTPPPQPPKSASNIASPPRIRYNEPISRTTTNSTIEDDSDDEGEGESYVYDNNSDEDEFGLPSIASMRRKAKRRSSRRTNDPGGGINKSRHGASEIDFMVSSGRPRANSSDIALERGPPTYPAARKTEGKILRPQYKDILRGLYIPQTMHVSTEI